MWRVSRISTNTWLVFEIKITFTIFCLVAMGVLLVSTQNCFHKILYQTLIKHISGPFNMRHWCVENPRIMRIVTMLWPFDSHPMWEVNLNLWKILTKFIIMATKNDTIRTYTFTIMGSLNHQFGSVWAWSWQSNTMKRNWAFWRAWQQLSQPLCTC